MCEKICSEGRVFVYLDHQTLIDESYNTKEGTNFVLRSELFDFRAKEENNTVNMETRKRKKGRKKENSTEDNAEDTKLLLAFDSIKIKLQHMVQSKSTNLSEKPTRIWEELKSDDFPKFKGCNSTASFQIIDNLVKGNRFLIPPNTTFFNYDVTDLEKHLPDQVKFDLIVLDPPWRNKYIRRLKKFNLGYNMLENVHLKELPIRNLIHSNSFVVVWCTNSKQHQEALVNDLLPAWDLRLLHTVKWLKLNTLGQLISVPTANFAQKQPYEHLFIACHKDAKADFGFAIKEVDFITSVPSVIHSHKPPLLTWFQSHFNELKTPKCLELFARYLQPNFTSFGLEVIKLMDSRLYNEVSS